MCRRPSFLLKLGAVQPLLPTVRLRRTGAADERGHGVPFQLFLTVNGHRADEFQVLLRRVLLIACGTMGLPHIAMRYFTAPSIRDAKMSTLGTFLHRSGVLHHLRCIGFAAKLYTVNELNAEGLQNPGEKSADC